MHNCVCGFCVANRNNHCRANISCCSCGAVKGFMGLWALNNNININYSYLMWLRDVCVCVCVCMKSKAFVVHITSAMHKHGMRMAIHTTCVHPVKRVAFELASNQ